ncbi:nitroreductase family protein [Nocardia cyriacigeorgica]|uniref:nitroreductase family protein n=1 Tax=Nocardia cyriacigeorgica TaxID=135487 RepID=UPI0021147162|nr:nitroreductase family protein [Nocardia cyriacigeorgica]
MAEDFPHLDLSADEVLTTTRSVRKRLDLERPVPLEVVTDALDVALQAPSGSNMQSWHWLVLTDPEPKKIVAEYYRKSYFAYAEAGAATRAAKPPKDLETAEKVASSATYLAEIIGATTTPPRTTVLRGLRTGALARRPRRGRVARRTRPQQASGRGRPDRAHRHDLGGDRDRHPGRDRHHLDPLEPAGDLPRVIHASRAEYVVDDAVDAPPTRWRVHGWFRVVFGVQLMVMPPSTAIVWPVT